LILGEVNTDSKLDLVIDAGEIKICESWMRW
jgi:hypothetical protein